MKVIPFTLQMLVENAIKHNIVSGKKPADNYDQQIWEFYRGEK